VQGEVGGDVLIYHLGNLGVGVVLAPARLHSSASHPAVPPH
jgi:hypothetical protein